MCSVKDGLPRLGHEVIHTSVSLRYNRSAAQITLQSISYTSYYLCFRLQKETRYPLTCPRDEDSPSELAEGTKPCRQVVTDFLNENGTVLGGVSIGVGVVMVGLDITRRKHN